MFGLSELAVILIVVIAVILAKKGPELARSAGKSARILKAEARAMKKEENEAAADTPPRIIPGETAVPGTGATAPGTERPSAPAPDRTGRTGGTPPQDSRP
ncbi:twin-arginine translocase TatA/TatE family subunit [Streptomyces sp. DT199]|uniref:twin-arginine translocase TatA/TatE family subunit n=1 Tax=Streptomyces sp. DT199 TaxID=3393421 RepID=UPI003CF24A83